MITVTITGKIESTDRSSDDVPQAIENLTEALEKLREIGDYACKISITKSEFTL